MISRSSRHSFTSQLPVGEVVLWTSVRMSVKRLRPLSLFHSECNNIILLYNPFTFRALSFDTFTRRRSYVCKLDPGAHMRCIRFSL